MSELRDRYIQDEKEQSLKEGIMIGKEEAKEERNQIITNILKEINDVNYIHKLTKIPLSEIMEIANQS